MESRIMTETALTQFWHLVWGVMTFQGPVFEQIQTLTFNSRAALYVVLLAGLSQAIGQSIILFVNKVKPIRFVLSLGIATLIFFAGYFFWALSTWGVKNFLFPPEIPFEHFWRTLGFAYSPQIFSFLVALPYFGVPIGVLLAIWSFLVLLVGLSTSLKISIEQAFLCGFLGWLVLDFLQRTIGRPISVIGRWLSNQVAGVKLVTDLKEIEQMVQSGDQPPRRS
jgi:hypothetical protein